MKMNIFWIIIMSMCLVVNIYTIMVTPLFGVFAFGICSIALALQIEDMMKGLKAKKGVVK